MKARLIQTLSRWPLRYLILVEVIYLLYEVLLLKSPGLDSPAVIPAYLLTALTMPSGAVLMYLGFILVQLFEFPNFDTHQFWLRFASWQLLIFTNTAVVALIVLRKKVERNAA